MADCPAFGRIYLFQRLRVRQHHHLPRRRAEQNRLHGDADAAVSKRRQRCRARLPLGALRPHFGQSEKSPDCLRRRQIRRTRRLRLGRHPIRHQAQQTKRRSQSRRLDHQPTACQKPVSERKPQLYPQRRRSRDYRDDGSRYRQRPHFRAVSERHRMALRRIRCRSRVPVFL